MKPPAPPPKQRRAFSTFGGPVTTAGEGEAARSLAGLFRLNPALARALTHGFHSYAGRMHPSIARGALLLWSAVGDRVLDPFCGSGTVMVEAYGLGRPALGTDASPLAVLLSQVRSTPLGGEGRGRLVALAAEIAEESGEVARKRKRPEVPDWAQKEFERFFPHVAFELLGLRELVFGTDDDNVGRALRLCFSSLLVKFMRSGPEAPRDGETKRIGRGVPSRFLAQRAEELARGLAALEDRAPADTPLPDVRLGDARGYPGIPEASVALVVTSPPYAGTYDYADQHAVRFTWLGLDQEDFRQVQLGDRVRSLGAAPREWNEGRRLWLTEMGRVLRPGGHAVLVVGDGVVASQAEDAALAITNQCSRAGLTWIATASQARTPQDRRLQEIFAGQPRREHLVLLRRG